MINTQKLGVGSRIGIDSLCREHGIPQTEVTPVEKLVQKRLVVKVRRSVQAHTARGKTRDGSLSFRFDQLWVRPKKENADRVFRALASFGASESLLYWMKGKFKRN